MTLDEKLAAILAAVQTDPGHRGLARDPHDNLFTATAGDFQRACSSLISRPRAQINTGFFIPSATPPAFETDGPLGVAFLVRALSCIGGIGDYMYGSENPIPATIYEALRFAKHEQIHEHWAPVFHVINIERAGPAADGKYYTMKGRDIEEYLWEESNKIAQTRYELWSSSSIGIGDGGNEIGMGKIPHETIVKNIPNGDLIHCRVPTDHLIVAGVSNWGAYALAAGLFVLKGVTPPPDLFDPDREREILEVMVKAGPLVDGVTGEQTATVDGLTWEEYSKPLIQIRDILNT